MICQIDGSASCRSYTKIHERSLKTSILQAGSEAGGNGDGNGSSRMGEENNIDQSINIQLIFLRAAQLCRVSQQLEAWQIMLINSKGGARYCHFLRCYP